MITEDDDLGWETPIRLGKMSLTMVVNTESTTIKGKESSRLEGLAAAVLYRVVPFILNSKKTLFISIWNCLLVCYCTVLTNEYDTKKRQHVFSMRDPFID